MGSGDGTHKQTQENVLTLITINEERTALNARVEKKINLITEAQHSSLRAWIAEKKGDEDKANSLIDSALDFLVQARGINAGDSYGDNR